ncbi:MAG: hypothetical protein J6P80_00420 [Kiritimatiellae bacterium]|nr:hypothetical protein [Kiritimatiellia bacterium]
MEINEFLEAAEAAAEAAAAAAAEETQELDVQKAVVEELAAEKAKLAEELAAMRRELALKDGINKAMEAQKAGLEAQVNALKAENSRLEAAIAELEMKSFDEQARNPNMLALLDREGERPDRFPGETRDHVLEVIAVARDEAEKEGRARRAQVLEAVLVAIEPSGALAEKRAEVVNLFS